MKRRLTFLIAAGLSAIAIVVCSAHADSKINDESAKTGIQNQEINLEDFIDPDGRIDLEALRASGYEGNLNFDDYDIGFDPQSNEPIISNKSNRSDPDDIYWADGFNLHGADGSVWCAIMYQGNLIVGGSFTCVDQAVVNHIASWDGVSWSDLGGGVSTYSNDFVMALEIYNGNLIVGGDFQSAGGVNVSNIAKWDGTTSTWSALGSGVNNDVVSLAVFDNKLICGGWFTYAGGSPASYIAAWDDASSSWSTLGAGTNSGVQALTVYNDGGGNKLVVGGEFTNYIATWNGTDWGTLGSGMNDEVRDLIVYNGDLVAGGEFSTAGGVTANGLASWNGAAWSNFNNISFTGSLPNVYKLYNHNGDLIVGGSFSGSNETGSTGKIVKWNDASSVWETLGSGVGDDINEYVRAITTGLSSTDLIVGGDFVVAGGNSANFIALWDGSWQPVTDGTGGNGLQNEYAAGRKINAMVYYDDKIVVGGDINTIGDISVNNIAYWNGYTWGSFGSGSNGNIWDLIVYQGNLIAAGEFSEIGGTSAFRIAEYNGSTWGPLGTGLDGRCEALAAYDHGSGEKLYVGGWFNNAGGNPASRIACWDGASWSALGDGLTGTGSHRPFALEVFDGYLIAGGIFTGAGAVPAQNIARWNGTSWSSFGDISGYVLDLLAYNTGEGDKLAVGGNFTNAGGVSTRHIAIWDGTSWSAFEEQLGSQSYAVYALAIYDNQLFIGGDIKLGSSFDNIGIAYWDGSSWAAPGSGIGTYQKVWSLLNHGTELYAGGDFKTSGQKAASGFARWNKSAYFTDTDGDEVYDANDNCPYAANTDQADADGDNTGNVCDNCPDDANAGQADGDSDEVGDICDNCVDVHNPAQVDQDSDGIGNNCDNCPGDANTDQSDVDDDYYGDVCDNCPEIANTNQNDNDNDDVGDVCDNCPDEHNTDQNDIDNDTFGDRCDNCPEEWNIDQYDTDEDDWGDECDNCPLEANTDQADADVDNTGNVCDNCPDDFNPGQENADADTYGDACDNCPNHDNQDQADADGDGHGDICDNCPNHINPGQEDTDNDGFGDPCDCVDNNLASDDWDNDGVLNDEDNCPFTYNPDQGNDCNCNSYFYDLSEGEAGDDNYGQAVANAGDVNADGTDDILVGAPGVNAVYLYSGLDGTRLYTYRSAIGGNFGDAVASAGYVNDDPYADIIIGAPNETVADQTNQGKAYIFLGGPGSEVDQMTYDAYKSLTVGDVGDNFGIAVSRIGDQNGDNFDEIAVGAHLYGTNPQDLPGAGHIFNGNTGEYLSSVYGGWHANWFGYSLAMLEDITGDGKPELAIGGPGLSGGPYAGLVNIYSFPDQSGIPELLHSASRENGFGQVIAGLGDANGNCVGDIAIGSPLIGNGGIVYVYDGLSFEEIQHVEGTEGMELSRSISGLGDINGDGYNDFAINGYGDIAVVAGMTSNILYVIEGEFDFGYSLAGLLNYGENNIPAIAIGKPLASYGNPGMVFMYLLDDTDDDLVFDLCDNCIGSDNNVNSDGDDIPDDCDNCPLVDNPGQHDSDGDGFGDVCDLCPGHDDNIDIDYDDIPDGCDNCVGVPNAADAVVDYFINDPGCPPYNNFVDPTEALCAPQLDYDGGFVYLGEDGGFIVLDMGEGQEIVDGYGVDFTIYFHVIAMAIFYAEIQVASDLIGPYITIDNIIGIASQKSYDLYSVGLSSARYVRILDKTPHCNSGGIGPGTCVDGIMAINYAGVSPSMSMGAYSPVDLEITTPSGKLVSRNASEEPTAFYMASDVDNDGFTEDLVIFYSVEEGSYDIQVIPDTSDTSGETTYTLIAYEGSDSTILADDMPVDSIPEDSYEYTCSLFICGDANGDASVNILDITFLISYLYKGGSAPDPIESGDVNSSGQINLLDITYMIAYLYKSGPVPACP